MRTADRDVIGELDAVLADRRRAVHDGRDVTGSYSATLLADPARATRKLMEESYELCWELGRETPDPARVRAEAADVVFHLMAALRGAAVGWDDVLAELGERRR